VLSSVPPGEAGDPVLVRYGDALGHGWLGYLSSSGVYGDTGGAWVDESAPTGGGRRSARSDADAAWLERGARVFRLPGIYGPGRSALDRVAAGRAHRIDLAGQVFSRVHVDDIASGVIAGLEASPGATTSPTTCPRARTRYRGGLPPARGGSPAPAVARRGRPLAAGARILRENRRVANGKARRVLGWRPTLPDLSRRPARDRQSDFALSAMTSPSRASALPATASADQR
jgi:nucleoside-diphosphate-sugar epimerase